MLLLTSTSDNITLNTASTGNIDVHASYMDYNGTTVTPGRTNSAQITTATNTTIVPAPGASTSRNVKSITIRNANASTSNLVTVKITDGTNTPTIIAYTLQAGESLFYFEDRGWFVVDASGGLKESPATGRLLKVSILTSGTSFTTSSATNSIRVKLLAGGGAGGGAATATSSGAAGGGGSSGGYAEKLFTVSPNTSYTYAIGAGGTAGAAGANAGNNGGNTTFAVGATTVTANGGNGGQGMAATSTAGTSALGGASPSASTNGDVNGAGAPGTEGYLQTAALVVSGGGGSSLYGGGGNARSTQGAGNNATGFGSGGGGGACVSNGGAVAGGTGSAGLIIVEEYS